MEIACTIHTFLALWCVDKNAIWTILSDIRAVCFLAEILATELSGWIVNRGAIRNSDYAFGLFDI
jgi:hypothetical protein